MDSFAAGMIVVRALRACAGRSLGATERIILNSELTPKYTGSKCTDPLRAMLGRQLHFYLRILIPSSSDERPPLLFLFRSAFAGEAGIRQLGSRQRALGCLTAL